MFFLTFSLLLCKVLATVSVGVTLVVMTFVTGMILDKAGRRSLMIIGTFVMGLALATLSVSLFTLDAIPRLQGCLVSLYYLTSFFDTLKRGRLGSYFYGTSYTLCHSRTVQTVILFLISREKSIQLFNVFSAYCYSYSEMGS